MAERPGQAGAGQANPASPLSGFGVGIVGGVAGVFLPLVAPITLVVFVTLALVAVFRQKPSAHHWAGAIGVLVGVGGGLLLAVALIRR